MKRQAETNPDELKSEIEKEQAQEAADAAAKVVV